MNTLVNFSLSGLRALFALALFCGLARASDGPGDLSELGSKTMKSIDLNEVSVKAVVTALTSVTKLDYYLSSEVEACKATFTYHAFQPTFAEVAADLKFLLMNSGVVVTAVNDQAVSVSFNEKVSSLAPFDALVAEHSVAIEVRTKAERSSLDENRFSDALRLLESKELKYRYIVGKLIVDKGSANLILP